jgi:hypothetical protein
MKEKGSYFSSAEEKHISNMTLMVLKSQSTSFERRAWIN